MTRAERDDRSALTGVLSERRRLDSILIFVQIKREREEEEEEEEEKEEEEKEEEGRKD